MPFAVAGIMGSADGEWNHTTLTWALCEFAALVRDLFGPACSTGGPARCFVDALCARMSTWVHSDFQALFGPAQLPKLHKLMAHLQDEFDLRGNVSDADTGINESMHRAVKKAWLRTVHRPAEYILQLVMAEQVSSVIHKAVEWETDVVSEDEAG